MLKFLFGGKKPEVVVETSRESFARVMNELNTLIAAEPVKPKIIWDLESGTFDLDLPEQLADEALALPAPEEVEDAPDTDAAEEQKPAA